MRRLAWQKLMSFRVSSFVASSNKRPGSAASSGPFRREQVRIRLSPDANRHVHPHAALETAIEDVWQEYKERSPRLFNATKFRLQSYREQRVARNAAVGSDDGSPTELVFHWGITDYKTYLGTCCSTNVTQLLSDGKQLARDGDEFAFLSRKVGVAAVVETSDAKIALIKRSKSVGVYQDMYDTPGGHPEPSHIGLTADALERLQHVDKEANKAEMETAAVHEFFASIVNEVHEEINLSEEEMSPPLLLGVVYQAEAATPSFAFYMKTERTAAELADLYRAGPMDVFESSKLELVDADKILTEEDPTFLYVLRTIH